MSKRVMNKTPGLLIVVALALFCSCQKQQTEAERNAEVDRQVQERLAAEHQTQQQKELEQRQADLDARVKALAEQKETAPVQSPPSPTSQPVESQPVESQEAEEADYTTTRPTASYSTFYSKLEPYGAWLETADYGYVWQPLEAERSRNWRPYTDGHWVYTDLGWMWVSEEPFGWAAYHYGRWTRLRDVGWVWVPGEQWAPAWVSWRKSNDYVGWAPLPPEARFDRRAGIHNWADNYYDIGPDQYSFVPTRQFGAQRVTTVVVARERNLNIVNETTNVTNITYNNTTVVNQGPDYSELRARTQQPIQRLRVERETRANIETEHPRSVVRGEVIEVPAPIIANAQAAERPKRIRQKFAQTTVDRGWEKVTDSKAAESARAKIRAESTPPPDAPRKRFVKPGQARPVTVPAARSTSLQATTTPAATRGPILKQRPPARAIEPPQPAATVTPAATHLPRQSASPSATRRPRVPASATPKSSAPSSVPPIASRPVAPRVPPSATPKSSAPSSVPPVSPRPVAPRVPPSASPKSTSTPSSVAPVPPRPAAEHARPSATAPASPAQTVGQPLPQDRKAKQTKKEKKREKKERERRGEGSPSATPTAAP